MSNKDDDDKVGSVRINVSGCTIYESCIQGLEPNRMLNDNIVNYLIRYCKLLKKSFIIKGIKSNFNLFINKYNFCVIVKLAVILLW